MSLKSVFKVLGKLTDLLLKGRQAGLWQKGKGPNISAKLLLFALPLGMWACAGVKLPDLDCRIVGCSDGFKCEPDPEQVSQWICNPEPVPSPTPKPVPSPSPIVPVPTPTPSPTPTPEPSPVPSPTPSTPPTPRPEPTPWKCRSGIDDKPDASGKDCWCCADAIAWARRTTNWVCPDSYPGKPTSCTINGEPAPCPTYDPVYGNGFCYSTGEGRQHVDRACNHVDRNGNILHKAERDGYTGRICQPPSPAPVPSPTPTPDTGPSPGPTPKPGATPATCPRLARVGGGLFACQNSVSQPKACSELQAGDVAVLDSTHHFGRRTVASCDEPHDLACGGRICDDQTNGTKFTVLAGGSKVRKTGTHQLKIGPLVRGLHRIELCANDDYRDALGQPVDTAGAECTVVEFSVP